jgi:hypothetical protein
VRPTKQQIDATRAVVEWYRATHYGADGDVGMVRTFCTPSAVGSFAANRDALESGEDSELFKLLVTVAMFQRLRDTLVMKILRGISKSDAQTLTSVEALLKLSRDSSCTHAMTNDALLQLCSLSKDASGNGRCFAEPFLACHLKKHTELLKRYGHFGKMPTSAALIVAKRGGGMGTVRDEVLASSRDPLERARLLSSRLSEIWRISDKISAMYLSLLCAPSMGLTKPPWEDGIDWTWFVVVDRNVDRFLETIGYQGNKTYDARRGFVRVIAEALDLRAIEPSWPSFHPRLVQQAMYLFMSESNRKAALTDCVHHQSCAQCLPLLSHRCPIRLVAFQLEK